MDNQNANNGGFPQGQNPPLDNNQPPIPPNQAAGNLENIRTQSVVESSRDVAEKELAAQEARNNQILKQQQAAARHDKEMHVAVKVVLIIFGILIFIALIWLVVQVVIALTNGQKSDPCMNADGTVDTTCCARSEYKDQPSCKEANDPLPTIDGYKCENQNCKKMADIIKNERSIIYDGKYYIHDIKKNTTTPTTIDNSIDYNSMSVFEWGKDKYYVILKPATEEYGLFSLDDNRQVVPNTVSRFYSDIKHKAYTGMTDVFGKYIIARESGQYRLYDIKTGDALASAPEGVFTYKNYIMTYSAEQKRLRWACQKRVGVTSCSPETQQLQGFPPHPGPL